MRPSFTVKLRHMNNNRLSTDHVWRFTITNLTHKERFNLSVFFTGHANEPNINSNLTKKSRSTQPQKIYSERGLKPLYAVSNIMKASGVVDGHTSIAHYSGVGPTKNGQ